jgi:hypothetical protein
MNESASGFRARFAALAAGAALVVALFPFAATALAASPVAPSVPDLAATSDTGNSNTDNVTKTLVGLVFNGTAEAGSTVNLILNGTTTIGSGIATGGLYSVATTIPLAADASSLISATATNGDGTGPASGALTVVTDTIAPAAAPSVPDMLASSDTGTSNTDNVTADTTPTFTGTSEAGATVQLFADGLPVGTGIASGTTWTITSSPLSVGVHAITADQYDAAGNGPSPVSGPLSVTINTSLPAAPSTPDLLASSDTGSSNTDNITTDTTPTFTGTAEPNSSVTLYVGAAVVGTGTADGSGAWTITSIALAAGGTYSFSATATDLVGTSPSSGALPVTIYAPLGVTINQAVGQGDPAAGSPINFTVLFSNPVGNFLSSDVSLAGSTASGFLVATVTGSGTTYNVAVTGMTGAGTVVPWIPAGVASDAGGNLNTASTGSDNSVTFDPTIGPSVIINSAAGQADPTGTSPINFSVTFSAPVSGFGPNGVVLSGTAGATTAVVTTLSSSSYNVAVSGMTSSGTVIASLLPNAAIGISGGHPTAASTSTDNSVTFYLASRYLVDASSYSPTPGSTVTLTAQLADAAGNSVSSYGRVITWSKNVADGAFSSATSTTDVNGAATVSFTVGPTLGTVYVISVSDGTLLGASPNIVVSTVSTAITLNTATSLISYGQLAGFNAQFSTNGASQPFILEMSNALASWTTVATGTTDLNGFAAFSYQPRYNASYRVRFVGSATLSPAISNTVAVSVRQVVTLRPTHSGTQTIARSTSITFVSLVRPLQPNLSSSTAVFRFYQKINGVWTLRYTRSVVAAPATGRATTTFRFPAGSWYVRVYAAGSAYNALSRPSQLVSYLIR